MKSTFSGCDCGRTFLLVAGECLAYAPFVKRFQPMSLAVDLPYQWQSEQCGNPLVREYIGLEARSRIQGGNFTFDMNLCRADSDGDGLNGEELLDPNCTWAQGDAQRMGMPSRPGDSLDPRLSLWAES